MSASSKSRIADAALAALVSLQVTMLVALFTRTPPHPPLAVPPFALGPFLGASIAAAAAALVVGSTRSRLGIAISLAAAAAALVSFGPQKWLDPVIGEIWPAVAIGELAAFAVAWSSFAGWRSAGLQERAG